MIKFDGSKGTKDFRIQDPDQQCLYYRMSDELSDAKLVTGLNNRFTDDLDELQEALDSNEQLEECKFISEAIP